MVDHDLLTVTGLVVDIADFRHLVEIAVDVD